MPEYSGPKSRALARLEAIVRASKESGGAAAALAELSQAQIEAGGRYVAGDLASAAFVRRGGLPALKALIEASGDLGAAERTFRGQKALPAGTEQVARTGRPAAPASAPDAPMAAKETATAAPETAPVTPETVPAPPEPVVAAEEVATQQATTAPSVSEASPTAPKETKAPNETAAPKETPSAEAPALEDPAAAAEAALAEKKALQDQIAANLAEMKRLEAEASKAAKKRAESLRNEAKIRAEHPTAADDTRFAGERLRKLKKAQENTAEAGAEADNATRARDALRDKTRALERMLRAGDSEGLWKHGTYEPAKVPQTVTEIAAYLKKCVDKLNERAVLKGKTNTNAGLGAEVGNEVHAEMRKVVKILNDRLAAQTTAEGRLGVNWEEFYDKEGQFTGKDRTGQPNPEGSVGVDYVIYRDGLEIRVLETKTGKLWTAAELQTRRQLWKVDIQILKPNRKK
jgi:hypothetical protein